MDNSIYSNNTNAIIGIPYRNINWEDIAGQPFGLASQFNLFIFGDANNIVDVEGAVAVGGSFYSPRTLSVGFEREEGQVPIEYSPDLVRYLVGNIISIKGTLGIIGHVVSGGSFKVAPGSTYYIGKDNSTNQSEELRYLYQAKGGSPYWAPSEKNNYYLISSYDVPRVIPDSRISANISGFFRNAKRSIETFKSCIEGLNTNGMVTSNSYEWILTGNNPIQNVFTIDVRPNGLINKGIRFNIPTGSVGIVRLRTGLHAHLQYGLYGDERQANHILYVFEDATDIHMEKSSDIWGSILAPQAMFHGHPTGGHVSGNAALGGFAVNAASGFEFHLYPFLGGVVCMNNLPLEKAPEIITIPEQPQLLDDSIQDIPLPIPVPTPVPCPACPVAPPCPTCPEPRPCPVAPPCPTCPEPRPCPVAPPCPTCPEPRPCPVAPPCPTCPEPRPCPVAPPCPTCPEPRPCPVAPPCPTCPEPRPCPVCPELKPCPVCPACPDKEIEYIALPIPVPIKTEQKPQICPVCKDCLITPGIISGCVIDCDCCINHEWDVMLYRTVGGSRRLVCCITICHLGYFRFEVNCNESYILKICPIKRNCFSPNCMPKIKFKNVGVTDFTIE